MYGFIACWVANFLLPLGDNRSHNKFHLLGKPPAQAWSYPPLLIRF
jgi:hypothetical protein